MSLSSRWARVRSRVAYALVLLFLALGAIEVYRQYQDAAHVAGAARAIVRQSGAKTPLQRVVALRRYLFSHVTYHGAAYTHRPFLRDSAGETLRSGRGYCGEVTRAFICMAAALDIPAQRINLYGRQPHVVAEVEVAPRQRLIVDCQNPPMLPELEPLDRVILRPEWDDYSTLNVRRLHLSRYFSRLKMEMGPLTYWSENPHALKAAFWFTLAGCLLLLKGGRVALRVFLRRRGWVHTSTIAVNPDISPTRS